MIEFDIVEREDGRYSPARSLPSKMAGEPQVWTRDGYYANFNEDLEIVPYVDPIFDKNGNSELSDDDEHMQIVRQLGNLVSHFCYTSEVRIQADGNVSVGIRGGGMEHRTLGTLDESGLFSAVVCLLDSEYPIRANNSQVH